MATSNPSAGISGSPNPSTARWRSTAALTSQLYAPAVIHPDGRERIESFESAPWPRWTFRLQRRDIAGVRLEVFVPKRKAAVAISWQPIWRDSRRPGDPFGTPPGPVLL